MFPPAEKDESFLKLTLEIGVVKKRGKGPQIIILTRWEENNIETDEKFYFIHFRHFRAI